MPSFRFTGLPFAPFERFSRMSDAELEAIGARRMIADEKPGFPCRVTLTDAEPGERVLLLSYLHQPADTPYKAAGPIFVREDVRDMYASAELPPVCRTGRLLSARAYDASGTMVDADVSSSEEIETLLARLFARDDTDYVHIHYAKRGCFAARVDRA
ncbi:MAG TPA: DUF1203 domain-containing protein [Rhizomicrobium sp.]